MNPMAQARALFGAGRFGEAANVLQTILGRSPSDADATQLLAATLFQLGRAEEGKSLAEKAVALDPRSGAAWNTLGLIRHLSGDNATALEAFEKATGVAPKNGEAWMHRGFVLQEVGRQSESVQFFERAIDVGFRTPQVFFFLGNAFAALDRHQDALAQFDRAIVLWKDFADAWNNRGNSLLALGMIDEGAAALERAAKLMDAEVREMAKRGQTSPEHVAKRADLVRSLQSNGRWRDALDIVKDAKEPELRFLHALTMPVVFESKEMLEDALDHLKLGIERLRGEHLKLTDPLRQVGLTAFHLPYFGISERTIQEAIADLYLEAAPSLRFEASHSSKGARHRLGVLSAMLKDHSVSRVFGGLIERLDRERFEVVYLQAGASDERSDRIVASSDRHVLLPSNLGEARLAVAKENLDILFYPEIGADPLCYFLAFSRLAPIQCTTWGHPLTTGSPVMDYFLSSKHLEREDGQVEYSEKLIRLPSLMVYYERPAEPAARTRGEYELPEDRNLYGCPQTAYKFHPDFDGVLAEIMRRDDRGSLVLIEPNRPYFKKLLLDRWQRSHPILTERAIWLDQMPLERFLGLLPQCDALLAPIQFGAGRSTLDALGVGAPVVTFKGAYLKSRITYAAYREVGLDELIAESEEDYVEVALRLGTDRDWRARMRAAVKEKASPLYENMNAVRELNEFFARLLP